MTFLLCDPDAPPYDTERFILAFKINAANFKVCWCYYSLFGFYRMSYVTLRYVDVMVATVPVTPNVAESLEFLAPQCISFNYSKDPVDTDEQKKNHIFR